MPENFPDLKRNRYPSTEAHCPKQDEPKEIYTKNFIIKMTKGKIRRKF